MNEKVWKAIKHNAGLAVATVICIAVLVFGIGCESKVASLTNPTVKITRAALEMELQQELDRLQLTAGEKFADLDRQDAVKQQLFEVAALIAQGGTVNPVGVATALLGILGVGAVVDNSKDKVISDLKNTTT